MKEKPLEFLNSVGKLTAHSLFPNDFELYFTALELVDSKGRTVDYFFFPINPTNIIENHPSIVQVKKTANGVVSLSSSSYNPSDIELSGNFGKQYKMLVGRTSIIASAMIFGELSLENREMLPGIKSGYGCIKVLSNILKKSDSLDKKGQPYSLYFYNLSLGNSYLVKKIGVTYSQSIENNMVWNYNLILKTLSPLNKIKKSLYSTIIANSLMVVNGMLKREASQVAQKLINIF